MTGKLIFHETAKPQGFESQATATWDGHPEPIVRELLQNCLDAGVAAGREKVEVTFTIREVEQSLVPGLEEYKEHFEAAAKERRTGPQSDSEKQTISKIKKVLSKPKIRVLLCRDNGVGLDSENMVRLLTEGNTNKDTNKSGAGSFGIGHLTAFAASDLRYVCYAGRHVKKHLLRDVSSGHAILASRRNAKNRGLSASGFLLCREGQPTLFDPKYPTEIPLLLNEELKQLKQPETNGAGSVVGILGFNNFRDKESVVVEEIAQATAKNFLVAVWQNKMTVSIRDETVGSGGDEVQEAVVKRETLCNILEKVKEQKRNKRGMGKGWLPGEQAYYTWKALSEGEEKVLPGGPKVGFRLLQNDDRSRGRVQIFRKGMWIANNVDGLEPSRFTGCNPFDAVVMIEDGEPEKFVRRAEGPEHRGLDLSRLGADTDKKKLKAILEEFREELRAWAGEAEVEEEYTPDNFAMLSGKEQRKAERVPGYRPRPSIGDEEDDPPPPDSKSHKKRRGGKKSRGGASPKPGKRPPGRYTFLAKPNEQGEIKTLEVYWRPDKVSQSGALALAVRVRIPSGSDETCESPLGPRWLDIEEVIHEKDLKTPLSVSDSGKEVNLQSLASDEATFTIVLKDPIKNANSVEVDFVGRRSPQRATSSNGPK